jgi:hypothetical protein
MARWIGACICAATIAATAIAQPDVPLVVRSEIPDLRAAIVSVDATAPGGPVVLVRISNVGNAASGATQIGIESTSGAFGFTAAPLPGISPSSATDVRLQIKGVLTSGDYEYRISQFDGIDPGPGKTLVTSTFTVPAQLPHVDLFVGTPSLDGVFMSVQVGNRGPSTAVGAKLRIGAGKYWSSHEFSLPDITSGESTPIRMRLTRHPAAGTLPYELYADPGSQAVEDNPPDNRGTGHLTITVQTRSTHEAPKVLQRTFPWWIPALALVTITAFTFGPIRRALAQMIRPRPTVEWIPVPVSGRVESDSSEGRSDLEVVLQLVADSGCAQICDARPEPMEVERG